MSASSLLNSFILHSSFFFFNATPTTYLYTLSLHDALPIWRTLYVMNIITSRRKFLTRGGVVVAVSAFGRAGLFGDRKSTRLNSSHRCISYAVFCLKKKKNITRSQLAASCSVT